MTICSITKIYGIYIVVYGFKITKDLFCLIIPTSKSTIYKIAFTYFFRQRNTSWFAFRQFERFRNWKKIRVQAKVQVFTAQLQCLKQVNCPFFLISCLLLSNSFQDKTILYWQVFCAKLLECIPVGECISRQNFRLFVILSFM